MTAAARRALPAPLPAPAASGHPDTFPYMNCLDGVRALAFSSVMFAHMNIAPIFPGGFGVTVFFFLSGYLISGLLFDEADRTGTISVRNFVIRRALRILPPFYLTILIDTIATRVALPDLQLSLQSFVMLCTHLMNYDVIATQEQSLVPLGMQQMWSVAVEEHFYLVYPWVFLALRAVSTRAAFRVLAMVCVAVLCWRIVLVHLFDATMFRTYFGTDTRIDSILFGALLAFGQRTPLRARLEKHLPALAITALVVLLGCFAIRSESFRETFRYSVQGLALIPLFHFLVTRPASWVAQGLSWSPLRFLGRISYPGYLSHTACIGFAEMLPFAFPVRCVIAVAGCLAYATAMHLAVERPLLGLRRRFR